MNGCRIPLCFACLLAVVCVMGCGESADEAETTDSPPVMRADPADNPPLLTIRELRRQLRANDLAKFKRVGNDIVEAELFQAGVDDLSALKGLPLRSLDLGMNNVSDISALAGMPLKRLILENTQVADLSVLKGMPLEVLQLQNTKVTDLSVLEGMPLKELNLLALPVDDVTAFASLPLQSLWLNQTQVKDLSPLKGKSLVSLDVEGTQVSDLQALEGMSSLKRLNISNTPVTDVSPLKGLKLERVTLTPQTIKSGMEVLRDMPSLQQIQTSMEGVGGQSATEFWQKFDAGVWEEKPEAKPSQNSAPEEANSTTDPAKEETQPDTDKPAADKPDTDKPDTAKPAADKETTPSETEKKDTQIPEPAASSDTEAAGT
ncbi:MAG: hypothetical protein R3C59_13400 [Planctomycetaceae bacterium]